MTTNVTANTTISNTLSVGSSSFSVNANGYMTNPTQTMCVAYTSNVGPTSITGDATVYTIPFVSTSLNVGSCFNTGTYTFTALVTGIYFVSTNVQVYNFTASHTTGSIQFANASGTTLAINHFNPYKWARVSTYLSVLLSRIMFLNANDTVLVKLTVSGGTKVVNMDSDSTNRMSFTAILLC